MGKDMDELVARLVPPLRLCVPGALLAAVACLQNPGELRGHRAVLPGSHLEG